MKLDFLWQSHPAYIMLCLGVGVSYAWFLYQKSRFFLFALRTLSVTLIGSLLLSFWVKNTQNTVEKKIIVLGIDDSQSVSLLQNNLNSLASEIQKEAEKLAQKGYEVLTYRLSEEKFPEKWSEIKFNYSKSPLSRFFSKAKEETEGRQIKAVVLVSDGIYNEGVSPAYPDYSFPIYTIGLGKLTSQKDTWVQSVFANSIVYLGNDFEIQADVAAKGLKNQKIQVSLKKGTQLLRSQTLSLDTDDFFKTLTFKTSAQEKGIQEYSITIEPIQGEKITSNNQQKVVVEVIEGQEKILLVAAVPHPDIKAIQAIVEKNNNLKITTKILSIDKSETFDLKNQKYDVIIFHQLPNLGKINPEIEPLLKSNIPSFFIVGGQTDLSQLNRLWVNFLRTPVNSYKMDKIVGAFNPSFKGFDLHFSPDFFKKLPPIESPFGNYKTSQQAEIILFQSFNSIVSNYPLLIVNKTDKKTAVFLSDGLWKWRMEEFSQTEKQDKIDEVFIKTIQYLSLKEDKRRFKVYPSALQFLKGELVNLETEMYNASYERMYGIPIELEIVMPKKLKQVFQFTPTKENTRYSLSNLDEGVYQFKAKSTINGKDEVVNGQFVVRTQSTETENLQVNHDVLQELSDKTNGKFITADRLSETFWNEITLNDSPSRILSHETFTEPIRWFWVLACIIFLLVLEWSIRKYEGEL